MFNNLKKVAKQNKVLGSLVAVGLTASSSFAGALTEDVVFDLGDVNYIFGGMVVAGVSLYAIKKAKALLGA